MKLKKLLATTLAVILILSSVSMTAFAFENENEFDIENLTWDDIMTMSNEDFMRLLNQFEREYDPFGTYETNPLTENRSTPTEPEIQPFWTSGEEDLSETGSHELITARACGILMDDKGFWGENKEGGILIALSLSLASIYPDRDPELGKNQLFAGHFYDPDKDSGKANTAKTNTSMFYADAVYYYDHNLDEFILSVGKMVHYVQDACEPHHASGMIAGLTPHSQFENFANEHLNEYIDSMRSIDEKFYSDALNMSEERIVHNAAVEAKKYAKKVNNLIIRKEWGATALDCTQAAVRNTVMILYKLSIEANIPMTK